MQRVVEAYGWPGILDWMSGGHGVTITTFGCCSFTCMWVTANKQDGDLSIVIVFLRLAMYCISFITSPKHLTVMLMDIQVVST